jgi:hypothetical protein
LRKSDGYLCARWTVFLFVMVVALAFAPAVAWAGQTDCTLASGPSQCAFAGMTPYAQITPTVIGNSTWTGTFSENVYHQGSTYIYVFEIHVATITAGDSLSLFQTGAGSNPNLKSYFDQNLNYGRVTDVSGSASGTFQFGSTLELRNLQNMTAGATLEFYAESTLAPGAGTFNATDGTQTSTPSLDPAPEPASLTLLGTGLLALGFGLRKRFLS